MNKTLAEYKLAYKAVERSRCIEEMHIAEDSLAIEAFEDIAQGHPEAREIARLLHALMSRPVRRWYA